VTQLASPVYSVLTQLSTDSSLLDSLDGIDTTPLASGFFGFVTAGPNPERLYRLDVTSIAAADGVTVVAPIVGPGRWLLFREGTADAFGADYFVEEDRTVSSTTDANFVTKLTLTVPAGLVGRYRINWHALLHGTNANTEIEARLFDVTDGVPVDGAQFWEPENVDAQEDINGVSIVTLAGVTKTFAIQWRLASGPGNAEISDAILEVWAVPTVSEGRFGDDYQFVESRGADTTTSAGFVTKATLSTTALTGRYRLTWHCNVFADDASSEIEVRLRNITDAATEGGVQFWEPQDVQEREDMNGVVLINFAGASKDLAIQFRKVAGSPGNVGVEDAIIELWKAPP